MGTTVANGVVKQLPYALLRNVNQSLPAVGVVILDSSGKTRREVILRMELNSPEGVPFYTNETLLFVYRAPNQSGNAAVCDLWRVNPTTGVESFDSTVSLAAPLQKTVYVNVAAMDPTTGALTKTVTYGGLGPTQ